MFLTQAEHAKLCKYSDPSSGLILPATPPCCSWQQIVERNQPTQVQSQMFPSCCIGSLPLSGVVLTGLLINCGGFNTRWHFVTYGFWRSHSSPATVKHLIWFVHPPNVAGSLRLKQMVLNFVLLCPNHLPALGPSDKVLTVCYRCWRENLYFVTWKPLFVRNFH